jgi:hypothetical protein
MSAFRTTVRLDRPPGPMQGRPPPGQGAGSSQGHGEPAALGGGQRAEQALLVGQVAVDEAVDQLAPALGQRDDPAPPVRRRGPARNEPVGEEAVDPLNGWCEVVHAGY